MVATAKEVGKTVIGILRALPEDFNIGDIYEHRPRTLTESDNTWFTLSP